MNRYNHECCDYAYARLYHAFIIIVLLLLIFGCIFFAYRKDKLRRERIVERHESAVDTQGLVPQEMAPFSYGL